MPSVAVLSPFANAVTATLSSDINRRQNKAENKVKLLIRGSHILSSVLSTALSHSIQATPEKRGQGHESPD